MEVEMKRFKYLEVLISNFIRKQKDEINERITAAMKMYHVLNRNKKSKVNVCKPICQSSHMVVRVLGADRRHQKYNSVCRNEIFKKN